MIDWSRRAERGSAFWVGVIGWIVHVAGWRAGRLILPGIAAWFTLRSARERAASREYLTAALGRPATGRDVFRHIFTFASAILERVLLLTGRTAGFDIGIDGLAVLEALVASGRGCVLLGAHFGSFEALRHLRHRCPVPVKALMYRGNTGALTRLLDALDPALAESIIPIGDAGSMLRAHAAVAAGGFVGMLADRSPAGAKAVPAEFFGRRAMFPTGPLIVAASLGCPVVAFTAVRTGPRRYRITFTPLADAISLDRATRQQSLAAQVQRYAAWLEAQCRANPFNWFNFYPFWETADAGPRTLAAAVAAVDAPADADPARRSANPRQPAAGISAR